MQVSFLAHCSGPQCAPQVCSAQLSLTVLAHNVCRKFAAHSCRALYWHTICAASMQRTVVAHYSGTQCAPQVCGAQLPRTILVCHKFAAPQLPCTALFCPHPLLPPPHLTPGLSPPPPYFCLVPYPQGEFEKKNKGMVVVLQKVKIWGLGWDKM